MPSRFFRWMLITTLIAACAGAAIAQTTAFTYQGRLTDGASAATGTYEMQFSLWTAVSGGTQIGTTQTQSSVTVNNGIFNVILDFGASPFSAGANRWLEVSVKKPVEPAFTLLTPRQALTSSPYSIRTISAGAADSLSSACVGCVSDAQIAGISGAKVSGAVSSATTAGNVSGTVAIANGGTGATTAANARNSLGLGNVATLSTPGNTTTFLRGDGTFATPAAGGATVDLIASKTLAQSLAVGGNAVIPDLVTFNSNLTSPTIGTFDGTTYTVGQTGFYLIEAFVVQTSGSIVTVVPQLMVNGAVVVYGTGMQNGNLQSGTWGRGLVSAVVRLTAGQLVTIRCANSSTGAQMPLSTDGTTRIIVVKL